LTFKWDGITPLSVHVISPAKMKCKQVLRDWYSKSGNVNKFCVQTHAAEGPPRCSFNSVENSDKWFTGGVHFVQDQSFRRGNAKLCSLKLLRARANTGAPRSSVDYDDEGVAGTQMPQVLKRLKGQNCCRNESGNLMFYD